MQGAWVAEWLSCQPHSNGPAATAPVHHILASDNNFAATVPASRVPPSFSMVSGPDGRLVSFSSAALPHQTRAALSAWTGGREGTHNNSTSCASSPSSNRSAATVSARHAPPHRSVSSGDMMLYDMVASGLSGYGPANHVLPPTPSPQVGEGRGHIHGWPPQPRLHYNRSRRASRPTSPFRQFGCGR